MFTFSPDGSDFQPNSSVPRRSPDKSADIQALQADVERLYFISEALWRILQEKLNLDPNEIVRQITTIDMEDGKLDSRKAKSEPKPCPKCGRTLAKQRLKCMFCGELIAMDPFER